ncbi:MAG TPA: hypothetical protein DD429_04095 [Clostridiaceae bacterium]|nr:hypothetical protein [Clostridiaceae bacterium]
MASKTINTILNLKDNFSKTIDKTTKNAKGFQRQIKHTQNTVKNMKAAFASSFKSIALSAAGLFGGIQLANFAKESVMLASDLQEVQNVVDTTFGDTTKTINDWSKTAITKFGLSELQAKQFNGTLGALMKSSGVSADQLANMSTGLTGLAGDFASFYNLDPEEAFEKIKSGISGETEPLKQLGINMSVTNLQAYALTQGIRKQYKEMSQSEQVQLRYSYLMNASKDAQGDFSKTNKGFANQLRILKTQFQQLGANIASNFLPYINKAVIFINDGLSKVQGIVDKTKNRIMELWAKFQVNSLLSYLKSNVFNAFNEIKTAIENAKEPVEKFITAVINLGAKIWSDIQPAINYIRSSVLPDIWDNVKNAIQGVLDIATKTFNFINDNWSTIKPLIEGLTIAWGIYKGVLLAQQGVTTVLTLKTKLLNAVMNANPIGLIVTGIGLLIGAGILLYKNWDKIKAKAAELWEGIKVAFAPVVEFFSGIWKGIKSGFKSLVNFIISGINKWLEIMLTPLNLLIKGANLIPGVDIPEISLKIPKIPEFAIGTQYFKGGLAKVNERGGEIMNLPNGSKIIPADKSSKIIKGKGNIKVYVIVQGNVIGNEEYADYLGDHIAGKIKLALDNL